MHFYSKQLADRWGIYEGDVLLATVGCAKECQAIIQALRQRQHNQEKKIKDRSTKIRRVRATSIVIAHRLLRNQAIAS